MDCLFSVDELELGIFIFPPQFCLIWLAPASLIWCDTPAVAVINLQPQTLIAKEFHLFRPWPGNTSHHSINNIEESDKDIRVIHGYSKSMCIQFFQTRALFRYFYSKEKKLRSAFTFLERGPWQWKTCNIVKIHQLHEVTHEVGLVVSMSDYISWGRWFDPWHFHKF